MVNSIFADFKTRDFSYLPIEAPRVERAIADDLAFLASHPVRRSKPRLISCWRSAAYEAPAQVQPDKKPAAAGEPSPAAGAVTKEQARRANRRAISLFSEEDR
jgi:hypothetical protein